MTLIDCAREQDVVDALTTGQWPDRCDAELRTHVAGCGICRDLVEILAPVGSAWSATRAEVHLPASGMVWWRAQMRARQEATRRAARPIAVAQAIGGLVAVACALFCVAVISPWLLASVASSRAFLSPGAVGGNWQGWLLGAAAAIVVATSLAVYFAVAED